MHIFFYLFDFYTSYQSCVNKCVSVEKQYQGLVSLLKMDCPNYTVVEAHRFYFRSIVLTYNP